MSSDRDSQFRSVLVSVALAMVTGHVVNLIKLPWPTTTILAIEGTTLAVLVVLTVRSSSLGGWTQTGPADRLAEQTWATWNPLTGSHGLTGGSAASIDWDWAGEDVAPARPDRDDATSGGPFPAHGTVLGIHDELYARLPAGRGLLVLLGDAGSGKTSAMGRLLCEVLERRRVSGQGHEPVPVWITLAHWDPGTDLLRHVVQVLVRDYPALGRTWNGSTAAGSLLARREVALFLDGLDEMPEDHQLRALREIHGYADRGLRVVLTSRQRAYRGAVEGGAPTGTAVVELQPLTTEQVLTYLTKDQSEARQAEWARAVKDADPQGELARVLHTPLMLALFHDVYQRNSDGAPVNLADNLADEHVASKLQERLFDRLLDGLYPDPARRKQVKRRLAWLASELGDARDLAWWSVPDLVPTVRLRIARAAVLGTVWGALSAVASVYWLQHGAAAHMPWLLPETLASFNTHPLAWGLTEGALTGVGGALAGVVLESPYRAAGEPRPTGRWHRLTAGLGTGWTRWVLGATVYGATALAVFGILMAVLAYGSELPGEIELGVVGGELALTMALAVTLFLRPPPARFLRLPPARAAGMLAVWCVMIGVVNGKFLDVHAAETWGLFVMCTAFMLPLMALAVGTSLWLQLGVMFPFLLRLVLLWRSPLAGAPAATPESTYRTDRAAALLTGVLAGLATGLLSAAARGGTSDGDDLEVISEMVSMGLLFGLNAGPAPAMWLADVILALTGHGRVRTRQLLKEATALGLLHQVGPVYRFRHDTLRAHLAKQAHPEPAGRNVAPPAVPDIDLRDAVADRSGSGRPR